MGVKKLMQSILLATVLLAVVGVAMAIACAPAAPSGGGSTEKKPTQTLTPTPTLHPDCVTLTLPGGGGKATSCPPPGPENIDVNLRRHYNWHMAGKEKAAQDGRRSVADPVYIGMSVEVTTHEAVDAVADFLEADGVVVVHRFKFGADHPRGRVGSVVAGRVNIELVPAIAGIDGVKRIKQNHPAEPESHNRQSGGRTVADLLGVDDWHAAGITGSGVEVAVLDGNFRDFRTRVAPFLSEPAKYLCFNENFEVYEGYVPTLTPTPGPTPVVTPGPTPTPSFVACEDGSGTGVGHGTQVTESLLEVAPDPKLYISDPSLAMDSVQYVQALDWLTAGTSDNMVDGRTVYDAVANDAYDVKVINHSASARWDGPGDGTSTLDDIDDRSLLNIVEDAGERGTTWVNAAGNDALRTWFSEHPPFNNPTSEGIVYLDFRSVRYTPTGTGGECNTVSIVSGKRYVIQSRWDGPPSGADVDLELNLARGEERDMNGVLVAPAVMVSSTGSQAGGSTDLPREVLELAAGHGLPTGDYCLLVTYDSGNRDLNWLQVQAYISPEDLEFAFHTQRGSMANPAESSSLGMLAVGAGRYHSSAPAPTPTLALEDYSARGPVPGIPGRRKPEVVGVFTGMAGVDPDGTSLTAPQVAGVAALVAQVAGPSVRPSYLAGIVSGYRGDIDLAQLPSLEVPTNVWVSQGACPGRRLEVQFDHPSTFRPLISYEAHAVQSTVGGVSGAVFEGSGSGTARIEIGTDRGAYDVTVRACVGGGYCGPWSKPPTRFTTTSMVCQPSWFQAVPGDGKATLWWNPDPDATGYRVDSGEGTASQVVSGEEHVVEGLTNGTSYRFRVQALNPGGDSDWRSASVRPQVSRFRPPKPTNLRVEDNNSRRFPGVGLKWDAPFGSYLYEVRISGGGANPWKRLPFKPGGEASPHSPYSARYFGNYGRARDETDRVINVVEAIIAGLVPGTEYHFAVRTAKKRNSSENLDYSPWSKPVTLTTLGIRPSNAPGDAAAPPLKAPPEDLMAEVSGTTVNLSWTAGTNPNYDRQVVLRREAVKGAGFEIIATLGTDATSYVDATVESGKTYIYRIKGEKPPNAEGDRRGGVSNPQEVVIP